MKKTYIYIISAILAAGILSCNKSEVEEGKSNDISFEVFTGIPGDSVEATKGVRFNSETDFEDETFGLYAWNSSLSDTPKVLDNVLVEKKENKWKPAGSPKWEDRDEYVFEAVYPKPNLSLGDVGLTAISLSANPENLTFSYKVPTTTGNGKTEDKDFMLAYYSGRGEKGVAPLTFSHPLTCVNFIPGSMAGIAQINSITLSGVYETGSCAVRLAEYEVNSEHRQCYSYEVSDTDNTTLWNNRTGSISVTGASPIEPSAIGKKYWLYNFLLIPQDTATQKVLITINLTSTAGDTYNVKATVKTDYWRAGYTNTYKINCNSSYVVFDPVVVTPWNCLSASDVTLE